MRIEKEDIGKKHIKRGKKENQNITSRSRLLTKNNKDLITDDIKCNQHSSEHNILPIPKKLQSMIDKDHIHPLLLSEDGISHINHTRHDRKFHTSLSHVSMGICASNQVI